MTKHGETDGYRASDFLREIEKYLGGKVDYILCNQGRTSARLLEQYREKKQFLVEVDLIDDSRLILADIAYEPDLIRHHRDKLADELMKLVG